MRAKPTRAPMYWEQVQQEIAGICTEREIEASSLTWETPLWDEVLQEAANRLYVKGRYQLVPF